MDVADVGDVRPAGLPARAGLLQPAPGKLPIEGQLQPQPSVHPLVGQVGAGQVRHAALQVGRGVKSDHPLLVAERERVLGRVEDLPQRLVDEPFGGGEQGWHPRPRRLRGNMRLTDATEQIGQHVVSRAGVQ